ncbi:acylphosphatase [Alteribacillus bidgolensis]|uniref:Acylphosphatase n=1 Tax=Alteribacillus bidgolensis TaxID=930129 RepID=A0A1G8N085_9BACI|nr:acylphosphatase [Alteribacillus bidgolensis]SDI73536.1 acylphosphatase [Alteribacillus bidgolensis]
MIKQHIVVHGKVQGVGFRNFTLAEARKLGIKGWVRNKANGTVEIEAEGTEKKMGHFLDSIAEGSKFSKVQNLDISEIDAVQHKGTFEVKY